MDSYHVAYQSMQKFERHLMKKKDKIKVEQNHTLQIWAKNEKNHEQWP